MRTPSRLSIGVVAAITVAALAAGCTSSSGKTDDPTVHEPTSVRHTVGPPSSPVTTPVTTAPPQSSAAPPPPSGRFTIAFAGDVNFADRTLARLDHPHVAFAQAAAGLRRADLTMVNLETAITTGGVQQNKLFTFRAPPVALDALRYAGIDVATMANNHGADYGLPGLHDTINAIRSHHFPVIGIGPDAKTAFAPYRTTLHGVKVAIFAADQVQDETTLSLFSAGANKPGVANAYQHRLVSAVHNAVRHGWVTIVYLHWGIEYTTCPSSDQSTLADELAQAGASAVIGTHAHVLQGAGWRPDGTYVAYGLGNYLWWMSFGNNQDDNGVLTLSFDHSKVVHAHFAASHLDDRGIPIPATGETKQRIDAEWAADRGCANLAAHPPH